MIFYYVSFLRGRHGQGGIEFMSLSGERYAWGICIYVINFFIWYSMQIIFIHYVHKYDFAARMVSALRPSSVKADRD